MPITIFSWSNNFGSGAGMTSTKRTTRHKIFLSYSLYQRAYLNQCKIPEGLGYKLACTNRWGERGADDNRFKSTLTYQSTRANFSTLALNEIYFTEVLRVRSLPNRVSPTDNCNYGLFFQTGRHFWVPPHKELRRPAAREIFRRLFSTSPHPPTSYLF